MSSRTLLLGIALTVAAVFAPVISPPDAAPPLPRHMAAVGDSITTATDIDWCCVNPDGGNPQYSWSTGSDPAVLSHYQRVLAQNGGSPATADNFAAPGADSGDLANQLHSALGADYVTVLIGGNDVCWGPTPVRVFRQRVNAAFENFFANSNANVLVASIPNLYRLWQVEHSDPWARLIWTKFGICPTILGANVADSEREHMLDLEKTFNRVLASACNKYADCRWDGGALFNFDFQAAEISPVDHYHPSLAGQNQIAGVTWAAGFWGV